MSYAVKEIFYTLQGEGANSGRPAVFCRFSGCNLWTGREQDRHKAICQFCDTNFVGTDGTGGGRFETPEALANAIASSWPADKGLGTKFVVCTGGEPLLQLDEQLIDELHARRFTVAVETNGTQTIPRGIDWLCVSPKAGATLVVQGGSEIKLVFPQEAVDPLQFEKFAFQHFYLQPMDGPNLDRNTRLALEYCLANPHWKLSIQTHKLLGIR
ncbi:MAG TPA: 7-carboxy-7-deazaguanine synthase [Gemmatimonadaceae bacterium]|nr:7-carboxy-7-deazaguanine synthase [Gemmatimonadaceae bacterium]